MLTFNAVIRSYAWDTMGRQLYVKTGSSAYYQITDPHGDNVAWASASALVGTEHFDPWGNLTYTPSGTTTRFGFQGSAGSWTDSATGFVSMGVRWYYPKVSEFLSSDPAAATASPRTPIDRMPWLYGGDDPLLHVDPTGLSGLVDSGGDYCDTACQADAREANAHAAANQSAIAASQAAQTGQKAPASHWCGKTLCYQPAHQNTCDIGSQTCGHYAANFGKQLLNIGCGLTICPMINDFQGDYTLVTDPSGWMQEQQAKWNSTTAYWSDQWNTYNDLANAPAVTASPDRYGEAAVLFGMKWSADRLQDFNNDPGTSSANIVVFFLSFAIPGPKLLREDPGAGLADIHPSTIVGRRNAPINVAEGTNKARTINGVSYSGHALDQMQARGFVPSVVENTLRVGNVGPGNRLNTVTYYDPVNDVTVVQNSRTGNIVTVRNGGI